MSCAQSSEENPDRGWRQVGLQPPEDGPTKDLHLFPMVQVGDKTYLHGGVKMVSQSGQADEAVQAHPKNVVFVYDWPSLSWSKIEYPESRRNGGFNQYGHVLVWTGEYFLAYGGPGLGSLCQRLFVRGNRDHALLNPINPMNLIGPINPIGPVR